MKSLRDVLLNPWQTRKHDIAHYLHASGRHFIKRVLCRMPMGVTIKLNQID
jgi:hypothetical protein